MEEEDITALVPEKKNSLEAEEKPSTVSKKPQNLMARLKEKRENESRSIDKKEVVIEKEPEPEPEIKTLSKAEFAPNNILFLIDVSLSMEDEDKLPALKKSMQSLTNVLRDFDKITIVTYATDALTVLETTSAGNHEEINQIIEALKAGGRTNGVRGFESAYETILQYYIPNGNNQIILATDGMFNQYNAKNRENDLVNMVRRYANNDEIKVSVIGFGDDKKASQTMRKLAKSGKGNFISMSKSNQLDVLVDEIKTQSALSGSN